MLVAQQTVVIVAEQPSPARKVDDWTAVTLADVRNTKGNCNGYDDKAEQIRDDIAGQQEYPLANSSEFVEHLAFSRHKKTARRRIRDLTWFTLEWQAKRDRLRSNRCD